MNMFNYFAGLLGVVKSEKLQTFQTKESEKMLSLSKILQVAFYVAYHVAYLHMLKN